MNVASERFLEGLVQVFTRSNSNQVSISIRDGLPIPPFEFSFSKDEFLEHLRNSDLSKLSIKSILDLGSLYFTEIQDALAAELASRRAADAEFGEKLSHELLPRLRMKDDPNWRYEKD